MVTKSIYSHNGKELDSYTNTDNLGLTELIHRGLAWIKRRENRLMIGTTVYSVKHITTQDNDTVLVYKLTRSLMRVEDVTIYVEPTYDGIKLTKMNTKHLLSVFKRVTQRRYSLVCGCCGEINGTREQEEDRRLEAEERILKKELDTREHVPNKSEAKLVRQQRAKQQRSGGRR